MAELYRYAAFISYSSKDAAFAKRLHRALESYGIPASLGKFDLIGGGKKNRIYPVFRDREELAAGHLGDVIEANLRASAALIVVCSPNAASSPWVQKEIEYFASLGHADKIFAIVADNAPLLDEQGRDATAASFPPAFRGDALSGDKLEPLAADARKGKDGFRNAWLKIVAGMIGVSPGKIIDRDIRRRRVRRAQVAAIAAAGVVVLSSVASAIDTQRWRTALAAAATAMIEKGNTVAALPYAISALGPRGAIDGLDGAHARTALEQVGAARIAMDLGTVSRTEYSNDGLTLLAMNEHGRGRVYDVASGDVRRDIPSVGDPLQLVMSHDGRVAAAYLRNHHGVVYHLNEARSPLDLGRITLCREGDDNFSCDLDDGGMEIAPDGDHLVVTGQEGRGNLYDLHTGNKTELGRVASSTFLGGGRWLLVKQGGYSSLMDFARVQAGELPERAPREDMADLFDFATGQHLELGFSRTLAATRDGRRMFTVDGADRLKMITLANRVDQSPIVRLPGSVRQGVPMQFSENGATLVVHTGDGSWFVDAQSGTLLAQFDDQDADVSRDGAVAIVHSAERVRLIDMRRGNVEIGSIQRQNLRLSPDAHTALIGGARDVPAATIVDIASGAQRQIGDVVFSKVVQDYILTARSGDRHVVLYDRRRRFYPVDLGAVQIASSAQAPSSELPDPPLFFLRDEAGQSFAYDLSRPLTRISLPNIGQVRGEWNAGWDAHDNRAAIVRDIDQNATLVSLSDRTASATDLGRVFAAAFSPTGDTAWAMNVDHTTTVFDVSHPVWWGASSPFGDRLRAAECAMNSDLLRPLSLPAQRTAVGNDGSAALRDTLRGRPRNPCDWRGLLAIFPDRATGDGWFEGLRQWLRLIGVVYLKQRDYDCDEINAAGVRSPARRHMCQIAQE